MEKIKKIVLLFIPFFLLISITVLVLMLFPKLMKDDIGKIEQYDLPNARKVLVLEERIETIDQISLDREKYLQVLQSMQASNINYYTDIIYDQLFQFAIQQGFLQQDVSTYDRSMKVGNYDEMTMFDFHFRGKLNMIQIAYTKDQQNLFLLYKNYRKNSSMKVLPKAMDNKIILQECQTFLSQTNLQGVSTFSPQKVWISEEEGLYMLEDTKNDIIVCYDLIENRPVGFVKGFGHT